MAGAKKKKTKAPANPARGFATTSIASRPRVENPDSTSSAGAPELPSSKTQGGKPGAPSSSAASGKKAASGAQSNDASKASPPKKELSPEEFEKQLEESELQLLVEKHAQKVRRDAQRQKSRLETDKRLHRSSAESVNTRKWLPQELMDEILDLIQAEGRFSATSLLPEGTTPGKPIPEEELTMKLWTLQQTLTNIFIPEEKVKGVLQYVLEIAPSITSTTRDNIWGIEEALDWLARECTRQELRDYDSKSKAAKSGML